MISRWATGMVQRTRSWRGQPVTMRWSRLALVLLAGGCSGYWGRRSIDQPTPVERRDPVWIWSGGEVMKWHAVAITENWVSGIPYQMSVRCDSCWRRIPRARVDSMKVGYHTFPETVAKGAVVITGVVLLEYTLCSLLGIRNGC